MRQLTSLDYEFLAMETPRQLGHVSSLSVLNPETAPGGRLELKDLCRLVTSRLHLLPPFTWRLAPVPFDLDLPYWIEDPDFDIDFHIRESAVPPPGEPRQVAEVISRIVSRPLDRAHPLWELYLIHGLADGRVGLLTKIHHAAVDGVSGAEIQSILLDPSPEGRELPPKPERRPERVPGQAEMLARGLVGLPRQPVRALRAAPEILLNLEDIPGVANIPGLSLAGRALHKARAMVSPQAHVLDAPPARAPRTRFNRRSSGQRRFAYGSLSLERVKAVKAALGITVNDVVVALCATALRDWLIAHGELPEEPLVAMVPVSTRTEEQRGTYGNRVSAMFVPVHTDEPDATRRLMRTHDELRAAKERHSALPAEMLQDAAQFIPPAVAARASRLTLQLGALGPVRPPLNLVVSNVPGPRSPLFCAGARLEDWYPVSVVTEGMGLNITVLSYLDRLDFGIVCDREQVESPWPFIAGLQAALEEVDREVCGTGTPREAPVGVAGA